MWTIRRWLPETGPPASAGRSSAEDGHWKLFDMSEDDATDLTSIDCRIALASVFQGMEGEVG